MNEPLFQLPGDPAISQIVTVLAKVGGLFLLYMILLMVIRYYVSADSLAVNAIRRVVGIAIGIHFAACSTRVFESHFYIPDTHFETLVFVVFVALTAAITGFVNQPTSKEQPNVHPPVQND